MKNLTAEKCRELVKQIRASRDVFGPLPEKEDYKLQALEIALPILEQQEQQERQEQQEQQEQQERGEWIEWRGGECPAKGKLVDVKFRDGFIDRHQKAEGYHWVDNGQGYDIIAYRIIPEQPTNQSKAGEL
ncbi:hypothetical protein [Pantoea agglomerans]|uniref:hypothetical protein n=1 Tax=Enterobacter agglomerans TaxID=549 RepID=UPI00177DBC28|nr:hypothetical protein [Pantoea agglomerans]MBD8133807.1 hypothetical protein [Pantoea agglomerans]